MRGKKGTKIDMLGQTRGRWQVLEYAGHNKHGHDFWKCRCTCPLGTERVVLGSSLRKEQSKSCGCLRRDLEQDRLLDIIGQPFGRLVVREIFGRDEHGEVLYLCDCECGRETVVRRGDLKSSRTQSCGCLRRELMSESFTTHGLSKSNPRLFASIGKHFRDLRKGGHGYEYWTLDPRYPDNAEGVAMFCMDMIALYPEECARYEVDKSLDLDKDNNTERVFRPEDCRFVSRRENINNRRNTLRLEDGRPLSEFCREVGIATMGENGKDTKQYNRISTMYRKRHKIHPELLQAANNTIALYSKTLALLRLRDEVRRFAAEVALLSKNEAKHPSLI